MLTGKSVFGSEVEHKFPGRVPWWRQDRFFRWLDGTWWRFRNNAVAPNRRNGLRWSTNTIACDVRKCYRCSLSQNYRQLHLKSNAIQFQTNTFCLERWIEIVQYSGLHPVN